MKQHNFSGIFEVKFIKNINEYTLYNTQNMEWDSRKFFLK